MSGQLIRVPVPLGARSYDVLVGAGALRHLPELVPAAAARAAVVTQAGIPVEVDPGVEHEVFVVPDGEQAKSLAHVDELCRGFAQWGLSRRDVVVAVGGGVVTDLAGFAAAVYHRGIAVVHVATTLLAQVDAAIGGKTGVNLPEGKNLVGAFWQPAGVVCDTDTLATLSEREWRSGTGEMAKYHFLGGEELERLGLTEKVAMCVAIKSAVVAADEREGTSGRRATLNYGHTLGHALETAGGYGLRHGEAVAIGLMFAARLASRLGRVGAGRVFDHERVVSGYGLPTTLPSGVDAGELVALMRRDKKAAGRRSSAKAGIRGSVSTHDEPDGLTLVLDGPNGVETVDGVDEAVVIEQLRAMGAR